MGLPGLNIGADTGVEKQFRRLNTTFLGVPVTGLNKVAMENMLATRADERNKQRYGVRTLVNLVILEE